MNPQHPYARTAELAGPSSPSIRRHGFQPPSILTTTLENAHSLGLGIAGQTPISATSLSSPFSFSAHQPSPYHTSPPSAMRGTSPVIHRMPTTFNMAYNPQQWGPVNSGSIPNSSSRPTSMRQSSQSRRAPVLAARPVGPDGKEKAHVNIADANISICTEPVASPPPPYSPRRDEHGDSSRQSAGPLSPPDTLSPDTDNSRYGTPVSTATTMSPDFLPRTHIVRSPVPANQQYPSGSPNAKPTPIFPPPPPASVFSNRVRSSSKNHADRILSSLTSRAKNSASTTPINAIDALRDTTVEAIARAPEASSLEFSPRPPASRRAASTGGMGLSGPISRAQSQSPGQTRWEPGMPLPPPPPGPPPPSTIRSQSMSRVSETPSSERPSSYTLRARRPPGHGTSLDTVPPTPADWREEDTKGHPPVWLNKSNVPGPLHIDTSSIIRKGSQVDDDPTTVVSTTQMSSHIEREFANSSLVRSPAVRNRSAKGIRERRSESRTGKGRTAEESIETPSRSINTWADDRDGVKPTDLVLLSSGNGLSRRRTANRSSPRSGKSLLGLDETLNSMESRLASADANMESSYSTPRQQSARALNFSNSNTPTPPFSPGQGSFPKPLPRSHASPSLPPKSLPTPPPQNVLGPYPVNEPPLPQPSTAFSSHILRPSRFNSFQASKSNPTGQDLESDLDTLDPKSSRAFAKRAIERHRNFAEREAAAADDSERLYLFSQFMLAESRIRRDQYAAVFELEKIDIHDLTQGLFIQPTSTNKLQDSEPRAKANIFPLTDRSLSGSSTEYLRSQGRSSSVELGHESPITRSNNSSPQHRPESSWWNDYVPCLSPIASMSMVTGQDEMDSRGRAPSRWWEENSGESAPGEAFKVLERSKRESKYMGLPPEARNSPALYESGISSSVNFSSNQHISDAYPPEKAGWQHLPTSLPPPPLHLPTPHPAPYTPDPRKLDVSRLVTLPPPYPRHHPAVNNNHPDLAEIRAVVRCVQDLTDEDRIRESFSSQIDEKRQRADSWCRHQRSLHNQDVQFRIEQGGMSDEDFDRLESKLESTLNKSEEEFTCADLELFKDVVYSPLGSIFSERIAQISSSFDELSSRLFTDAQRHSPNMPQEEGDEQPELLEKLTLLKWLYEARETLHRERYNLETERNEKYRAMMLLPYKHSRNHEKLAEAESFFVQDGYERRLQNERNASSRFDEFVTIIEVNVVRGVEVQLSAFWDIAPALLNVLHKIPRNLQGFEIQIPPDEYGENPSYYGHPMQYLYSLLGHAEKSSYQFIESQINLLCLLHEIKEGALVTRYKVEEVMSTSRGLWGGDELIKKMEMRNIEERKKTEEKSLTDDLKEKVGIVEKQWHEALGEEMMGVRERVREWLLEKGGWTEDDEES